MNSSREDLISWNPFSPLGASSVVQDFTEEANLTFGKEN
jgi:hypothetical protein